MENRNILRDAGDTLYFIKYGKNIVHSTLLLIWCQQFETNLRDNWLYRLILKDGLTNSWVSTLYQDCSLTSVRSQNDLKVPRKLIDVTNISISTENRISKTVYSQPTWIRDWLYSKPIHNSNPIHENWLCSKSRLTLFENGPGLYSKPQLTLFENWLYSEPRELTVFEITIDSIRELNLFELILTFGICIYIHIHILKFRNSAHEQNVYVYVYICIYISTRELTDVDIWYIYTWIHIYIWIFLKVAHNQHIYVYVNIYLYPRKNWLILTFRINIHIHIHILTSQKIVHEQNVHDDDCFYYHSWRNNLVIAFGTLSSLYMYIHIYIRERIDWSWHVLRGLLSVWENGSNSSLTGINKAAFWLVFWQVFLLDSFYFLIFFVSHFHILSPQ